MEGDVSVPCDAAGALRGAVTAPDGPNRGDMWKNGFTLVVKRTIRPGGSYGRCRDFAAELVPELRHPTQHEAFNAQFRRAAKSLADREADPRLAKITVSERQLKRWVNGEVTTTPRADTCRVLEASRGPGSRSAGSGCVACTRPARRGRRGSARRHRKDTEHGSKAR